MKRAALILLLTGSLGMAHGKRATHAPAAKSSDAATLRDYQKTIQLLETGLRANWSEERMRRAFVAAYGPGITSGQRMTACGYPVFQLLRPHEVWDEHPPFAVSAQQTLEACKKQQTLYEKVSQQRPAQ